jgi:hypothetical protein
MEPLCELFFAGILAAKKARGESPALPRSFAKETRPNDLTGDSFIT